MKLPTFLKGQKGRERPTLGLDIGSHTIKLVEFSGGPQNRIVRRIGRAHVPPKTIVDGSIRDHGAIAEILRELIKNAQPKVKNASISIAGYSVIVKKIALPYRDEKEIETNLTFEAEKYVPFEISDVYIDFHVLDDHVANREKTTIFLVAAKREIVDSYAQLVQSVDLAPSVVDVDVFALGNAFEGAFGAMEETVALVDIGAQKTNLNIMRHGMPLFARDMPIGGAQLTDTIHQNTGLGEEEAETVKISGTEDVALSREIASICHNTCTLWGAELKKAIDFHNANSTREEHPKYIFLSGGSSLMRGLDAIITRETELPARIFDPIGNYSMDPALDPDYTSGIAPQLAIATGLALRTKQ